LQQGNSADCPESLASVMTEADFWQVVSKQPGKVNG
jgi:hypothetical protein